MAPDEPPDDPPLEPPEEPLESDVEDETTGEPPPHPETVKTRIAIISTARITGLACGQRLWDRNINIFNDSFVIGVILDKNVEFLQGPSIKYFCEGHKAADGRPAGGRR